MPTIPGEQITLPIPGATPDVIPTVNETLEPCEACEQTAEDCDCCTRCERTAARCDCCTRCERTAADCDCCSICNTIAYECNHCLDCERPDCDCECPYCQRCDRVTDPDEVCEECGRCDSCGHSRNCESDSDDDDTPNDDGPSCSGSPVHAARWHGTEPGKPFPHKGARLVGLEVEFNSAQNYTTLNQFAYEWRAGMHTDGSCGYEVVTAPIAGPHIASCVSAMSTAFAASGATADGQCGVHVHVDARDLLWEDIYRLVHVYARLEPLLYALAGQHRAENTYCKPVGKTYAKALGALDRKDAVLAAAYAEGPYRAPGAGRKIVQNEKPGKKHSGRYKGLNICPWLAGRRKNARGRSRYSLQTRRYSLGDARPKPIKADSTVEFRLHRNTLKADRLTGWATVLASLVSWCAKASHAEAQALPRSPLRALCMIAPESRAWILDRVQVWRHATRRHSGVRRKISVLGNWSIKGGE